MDDILDSLQDKLECRRYSTYLAAMCVFHQDHTPSLMVYEDFYRCLACGASGTTQSLLKKLNGNTILHQPKAGHVDVFEVKNPFFGWLKENTLVDTLKYAWEQFNLHPEFGTYITESREIDPVIRRQLGIGHLDGFYTFPIRSMEQKVIGAFVRCPVGASKRYFVPRGQDPNLLYIPRASLIHAQTTVFMTFGCIDAITLCQMGYAAISTTNGKRISIEALQGIRKRIVILPDRGEEAEAFGITQQLGWRGSMRQLDYPDGCKDVNSYFCSNAVKLQQELQNITEGQHSHDLILA